MPLVLRRLLLALMSVAVIAGPLAACSSVYDDDATAAPAAFVSKVDGKTYCPWVETRHECDGSPFAPTPFPIPTDRPSHDPGMSAVDYILLMQLFDHGVGYHDYYYRQGYYDTYIGPSYTRYPGQVDYGYGHRPMTRVSSDTYNKTVIYNVNTKYKADEDRLSKNVTYKTAGGKTLTGDKAVKSGFKGTNVPATTGRAGDAPVKGKTTTTDRTSTTNSGKSTNNGKSSYGGSTPKGGSPSGKSGK